MQMINLSDRLAELDVLLDYVEPEEWDKIPDNVIFYIKENKNPDYKWEYDCTKSLEEQDLNRDTIALLTFILYKYSATDEEKSEIKAIVDANTEELNKKYDVNNIFNNQSENTVKEEPEEKTEETTMIKAEENKETIWNKIISFFKGLFK